MTAVLDVDAFAVAARPTAKAAVPFVAVAALGLTATILPPYSGRGGEPVIMFAVALTSLVILGVSLRRVTRTWIDPVAPFLFFVVVALARDLTGGVSSGLSTLILLPVLWLAMWGTCRDLMVSVGLICALFLVPVLLIGGADYPVMDWRRALLWSAFAGLVAPVVQRLVRDLAVETAKVRATGAELEAIVRGASATSIIATDVSGTVRSFGVGAEEMLGYSADEIVGRRDLEIIHDRDEVEAVARELGVAPGLGVFAELARRNAPSRTWTYIRADGVRLYVHLAVTEMRDLDGVLMGYLGVAIDSTAAVKAQAELALSEARWRALVDHLPDTTLVMVDEQHRIELVSGGGAMRQGFRRAEGRILTELTNPENTQTWNALLAEAFAGREASNGSMASRSGAEHEVVVTPLPASQDGAHALILARDVSRERERQRALVRAKERAERLFSDAPYGVAVLDAAGVVQQVNNAMRHLIGPILDGIEGLPLASLSRPGDDTLERHLAEVRSDPGAQFETDWNLLDGHGHDMHVVLSSRLIREDDESDDLVLVNVVDVSERRRYEQRLAHLADHDALTGLANRRRFDEEMTRHLDHCARYGPIGALLLLDLDHFKEVNDTLGHGAGDELIVSTAALLVNGVRSTDVVARLGGDEFAILLPEADRAAATTVASAIVQLIEDFSSTLDGARRRVTASIGVVTMAAASGQASDLLALADMTMYDAKDAGRNRIAVLGDDAHRQTRTGARLQWKGRIEQALENDSFALHLQPILDLATGKVGSAEVLLRLDDADELILPSRFLYIAERAGLMPAVDEWVLGRSIAMLARLRDTWPDFQLEVNLSGLSIGNPDVERIIVDGLTGHDVDPSGLILEITETAAVADVELARQFADRITGLGSRFALDDFGAGFGSFYYLKQLRFDYVKIDGEFVANCHRSSVDRSILRSIVGIAHDLGKRTVAQFVTDQDVLDVVRAEGVDLAQGNHIGKPVPFDVFTQFLTDRRRSAASLGLSNARAINGSGQHHG